IRGREAGCAFQAAAALKSTVSQNTIKPEFITRAMHVSEYVLNSMFQVAYRLQPKPRSVLINSNRVDKRVFLSKQYATVRCANGQSGQLPITQLAYGSGLHQSAVILNITFHFQYSWLS